MPFTVLTLPGISNSDVKHWQSFWEKADPRFVRVRQRDWENPVCAEWVGVLEETVSALGSTPVLAAHSLGCLLVAHWARNTRQAIKGALLVAPPNPEGSNFPEAAVGFSPVPCDPLPFPSIIVASSNDPYASLEYAQGMAEAWGSRFIHIGPIGHISSNSRLGNWEKGLALLRQLT